MQITTSSSRLETFARWRYPSSDRLNTLVFAGSIWQTLYVTLTSTRYHNNNNNNNNKCIGDDTKAAARQSPNCIKNQKKIWLKKIFNMADGIITPCNVARSWHWFRQVTAPCNVIRGFEITCCWIRRWQHPAVWHVAQGSWHWIRQMAAPCNVAGGSGMT